MPATVPTKGKRIALSLGCGLLVVSISLLLWYHDEVRRWYVLWRQFESVRKNPQGCPEYRHRETGIVFVALPAGEFYMGTPNEEGEWFIEDAVKRWGESTRQDAKEVVAAETPHKVTLTPFLVAKYEVTQAEWEEIMGKNPSHFIGDALPVEEVSWEDCQEFCKRTGLSLPTEAQWEYACRAGTTGPYGGPGDLDDMGWYQANSGGVTHPVGQKQPNGFGVYDMHGNVFEWCEDVHSVAFYGTSEATHEDPVCTAGSLFRVIRGGNWGRPGRVCRSAWRGRYLPSERRKSLGLRPVFNLR